MNLQEIEEAFSRFKICPKCNSTEGFWLGLKGGHAYVGAKAAGGNLNSLKSTGLAKRVKRLNG